MRSMARFNNYGFSCIELAIAMLLVILLMGIVSAVKGRLAAAQGERTVTEMQGILNAAREYYSQNNNTWPSTMTQLQTFIPHIIVNAAGNANNVFGNQYVLVNSGSTFAVQTTVPSKVTNLIKGGSLASILSDNGVTSNIQCVTITPIDSSVGRLQYDKKYSIE